VLAAVQSVVVVKVFAAVFVIVAGAFYLAYF